MWCRLLIGLAVTLTIFTSSIVFLFEPYRETQQALPSELQPFRPLPIRIGNAINLFLKTTFNYQLIKLDARAMIDTACTKHLKATNSSCDFGEEKYGEFRPAFETFINSLNEEAELTLIGRVFASHRANMLLDQRLQMVHHWKTNPVDHVSVRQPLFVVGLPRTGTTFLHTLLAQDTEQFLSPLNWMVVNPHPPQFGYIDEDESEAKGVRKRLIDDANYNLDQFKAIAKDVDAQHVMNAFAPEECIVFQAHTFVAFEFLTYFTVPSFSNWLRDCKYPGAEYKDAFTWHKQVLKHMASVGPKSIKNKSWVLKTPFHMGMMDDMLNVYPDARIIMTHRRPVRALSSLSKLQIKLRTVATDKIEPKRFAKEFLSLHSEFAGRAVDTRKRWEKNGNTNVVVDVNLIELHTNPMKLVERVYKSLNLKLSDIAMKKMKHWLKNDGARGKHGTNVYKAEWFGLEDQDRVLKEHPRLKEYDDFYCSKFDC